jgi:hypothetical protein
MTTPPNSPRLPADLSKLPVLDQVVEGYAPQSLHLSTESGTLGKRAQNTYDVEITPDRPLLKALKQLIVKAGLVTDAHAKSTSSIKPTELALRTKNGNLYKEAVGTETDLEATVLALDARAHLEARGLKAVTPVAPVPAPATVTTIERSQLAAAAPVTPPPAPVAPAAASTAEEPADIDVVLPQAYTGAERTVMLSAEDHLRMQADYARDELDGLTGGQRDTLDNLFDDSAFDDEPPKPTLKQRILAGLPGALTSGAVVAATKVGVMSALGASVSAFALAPAITTIGGIGAGIFVGQSVAHLRARWTEAEAAKGEKISLKQVFQACASKENISREWAAYRDAINNRDGKNFWKQALVKGTFAASIGAAVAWAPELSGMATEQLNKTETGAAVVKGLSATFNTVADKTASAWGATKKFFSTSLFAGNTPAPPPSVAGKIIPAAPASAPAPVAAAAPTVAEPPAAAAAPVEAAAPLAPIEKVRALLKEMGVSDNAANKLLNRTGVTEAQRINDVAVGLNNGVYGMPLNKDSARDLFQTAKDMGNAKAALDLDVATGKVVPPAPVAAPAAVAEPTPAFEEGSKITDDQRRAAFAQAGVPFVAEPLAPAAVPAAIMAPAEDLPPTRLGAEVARCVLEQVEKGKMAIKSLCSIFSDTMKANDHVIIEGKGMGVLAPDTPEGMLKYGLDGQIGEGEAADTRSFMRASRRDFRDSIYIPWLSREAQ